jgi:hypothetical protein
MKPFNIKKGTTRNVWLVGKYAIKFPTFYSWELFLEGLLGNLHEHKFGKCVAPYVAPILFRFPLGFMNVYPRCDVKERDNVYSKTFFESFDKLEECKGTVLYQIVEYKPDSVGMYNNKLVAVDYGSSGCGIHNTHLIQTEKQNIEELSRQLKINTCL